MKVMYVGLIPSHSHPYSTAQFETEDGTKLEIKNFLSPETMQLVEMEARTAAKRKFTEAAQETNLLESKAVEAPTYDTDVPF